MNFAESVYSLKKGTAPNLMSMSYAQAQLVNCLTRDMTINEFNKLLERQNHGKVAPSEHNLQVACVRWFRYSYPNVIIMAIPNGGYRTAKTAAIMKAEGQLAGVPDLFIPIANKHYHGLWIEMKNGKAGRLSDAQKKIHETLKKDDYAVETCRDEVQFRKIVTSYLS